MSKKTIYPVLLLGTYILLLCSSLAYISFVALGAEDIFIDVFKHLII
ncbi:hypothetical protein [Lysinibacillus irui]|uniref:Uncharacterized protein n=1 Tax=Lysinibacillus irui TaxID=2998077 RepID=A0AAJ5RMS3_9BACI|nr:hypothetical protein [Lysinibacillus irui]WDV09302.1 hypothetical protein OU989_22525 [Lysinibacillus irui]